MFRRPSSRCERTKKWLRGQQQQLEHTAAQTSKWLEKQFANPRIVIESCLKFNIGSHIKQKKLYYFLLFLLFTYAVKLRMPAQNSNEDDTHHLADPIPLTENQGLMLPKMLQRPAYTPTKSITDPATLAPACYETSAAHETRKNTYQNLPLSKLLGNAFQTGACKTVKNKKDQHEDRNLICETPHGEKQFVKAMKLPAHSADGMGAFDIACKTAAGNDAIASCDGLNHYVPILNQFHNKLFLHDVFGIATPQSHFYYFEDEHRDPHFAVASSEVKNSVLFGSFFTDLNISVLRPRIVKAFKQRQIPLSTFELEKMIEDWTITYFWVADGHGGNTMINFKDKCLVLLDADESQKNIDETLDIAARTIGQRCENRGHIYCAPDLSIKNLKHILDRYLQVQAKLKKSTRAAWEQSLSKQTVLKLMATHITCLQNTITKWKLFFAADKADPRIAKSLAAELKIQQEKIQAEAISTTEPASFNTSDPLAAEKHKQLILKRRAELAAADKQPEAPRATSKLRL
jgi:hypothetical protein